MTQALAIHDDDDTGRARKCIVSGEVRSEAHLIRFVVSPDGEVVPDVAVKLPGRGMWVSADAKSLATAIAKNAFSKSAKRAVKPAANLADTVVRQLVVSIQGSLGIARKAGNIVLGFDSVIRSFDTKLPPALLVEASDGAADGRRKLVGAAKSRDIELAVIAPLTAAEMSLALGRENVIHAALKPGPLAERLIVDAGRLSGFRLDEKPAVGERPAPDESVG
ncbi:MAG TPA: RNA-binding protein [Rhizomicrobium sp.]|nr:RNA-binding protein [Rhizomicrobium sp.]